MNRAFPVRIRLRVSTRLMPAPRCRVHGRGMNSQLVRLIPLTAPRFRNSTLLRLETTPAFVLHGDREACASQLSYPPGQALFHCLMANYVPVVHATFVVAGVCSNLLSSDGDSVYTYLTPELVHFVVNAAPPRVQRIIENSFPWARHKSQGGSKAELAI